MRVPLPAAAAFCISLASVCGAGGCATLPDAPVQRSLYSDLRQIVDTRERVGWVIDRSEIHDAVPSALQSVCQVAVDDRRELLEWFDRRIEEEGGPAELAYADSGEDLDAIEELLTLERMRALLEHADELSAQDCPFWMEPDPDFAGVQTDTDRFVMLAESIGGLSFIFQADDPALGGGGGLRLLPGYGFNHRLTIVAGVEVGGAGFVTQPSDGGEQTLSARPTGAVPLVVRIHDDTWLFDVEVAALTQLHDGALSYPPGLRVAGGVGIGSVRIGSFMPYALGIVAYELMPAFRDLGLTQALRIGTRVGLNIDP